MSAMNLSRRLILLLGSYLAARAFVTKQAKASSEPVLLGAIRWDAWDAKNSLAIEAAEKTLGPHQYQRRAPFCSKSTGEHSIEFSDCNTQKGMDTEIGFAADAGIDYWAYCWYDLPNPLMNAWALHQSSAVANRMKWCIVLQFSRMSAKTLASLAEAYVVFFMKRNYQKVFKERPLVYIFVDQISHLARDWGGLWENVREALLNLQNTCTKFGIAAPYIVIMHNSPIIAYKIMSQVSADAISSYTSNVQFDRPASYRELAAKTQLFWDEMAKTGAQVIPICMTGWDTRPRHLHPPPWQLTQPTGDELGSYVYSGTPEQIAAEVLASRKYVDTHPSICAARTAIIYSWNECDEGGSALVPTLGPGKPDQSILDAVKAILSRR